MDTFALPLLAAVAFAKGPYVQELGADTVTVRFELDAPAPATVEVAVRATPGVKAQVADPAPTPYHAVRVAGLTPATTYRYVARAGGTEQEGSFTTAPAPSPDGQTEFTFLVYGDNRTDPAAHAAVVRAMLGARGDFFVHTGDFVHDGGDADDWRAFFDIERPLLRDRAVFGCVGNHELVDRAGASYLRYFGPSDPAIAAGALPPSANAAVASAETAGEGGAPAIAPKAQALLPGALAPRDAGGALPAPFGAAPAAVPTPPTARARLFWTFRWGSARFFLLNAFDTWTSGEERAWLEAELAKAKSEPGVRYRVAVLHHGPWSSGPHGNNARVLAAGVPELLARSDVDLVLAGHDHIYERGFARGLRYVVSGGGGAPLYRIGAPVEGTRKAEAAYHFVEARVGPEGMKLVARRVDGSVIEACGFRAGAPASGWDCDPPPAPAATASAAPSPAPPSSRCACRAAGSPSGGRPFALLLVPLAALAYARRRCAPRWSSR